MKATRSRTAIFGPYTLDIRLGELRKHGIKLKMGEQSFRILCMLLENQGEMVSREELRAKLWADDTFVEFDQGLNSAIKRLRDCLSDSATKPRWVETIPRRGYRFIGQMEWSDGVTLPPSEESDRPKNDNVSSEEDLSNTEDHLGDGNAKAAMEQPHRNGGRRRLAFWFAGVLLAASVVLIDRWVPDGRFKQQPREDRSLAVLQFENFSGDPGQEYLADGITDELITILAKNPDLRVTSRTSVMRYKGTRLPLQEIARELNVNWIVEGSIARVGNRVRARAQLIHTTSDTHVWAESYDHDLGDIFPMQSELARAIAKQIGVTTAVFDKPQRPISAEAYDAYLKGRYFWFAFKIEKSLEFYQKAIDLQPDYAAAWSGLADSLMTKAIIGETSPEEVMPQGEAAARKAVALDDALAEAHISMAAANLWYRWNWEEADKESARAVKLKPSFGEGHHLRSYVLMTLNRMDEALQEDRKATELDPFTRPWASVSALIYARRFEDAVKLAQMRCEARPNDANMHEILANAYRYNGMEKESAKELERSLTLSGDMKSADSVRQAFRLGGQRAVLEWELSERKKQASKHYVSPMDWAHDYAQLQQKEETIFYLQESYRKRAPHLVRIQWDPIFDFVHSEPRYRAIIENLGLPPAY